jgi:uncharacterized membrane protein (UPF0182 family)
MILLPAVFVLLVAIGMIAGYLEKWLWMRELNYTGIFWTLFSVRWVMFIAAFICCTFGSTFARLSVLSPTREPPVRPGGA